MALNMQGPESIKFQDQQVLSGRSLTSIPNGSLVRGVVLEVKGDGYIVEIWGQRMFAVSSLNLAVGDRFTGIWDSTSMPPVLKLKPEELSSYGRLNDNERAIVNALIERQLPVTDDLVKKLSSFLVKSGLDLDKLPMLVELYARGMPLDESYVKVLFWYFNLTDDQIKRYFGSVREKLKNNRDMKNVLQSDREEGLYARSLALLSRPLKDVIYPYHFIPLRFCLKDGENIRVWVTSQETPKKVIRLIFHFEGVNVGLIEGELVFDANSYGVTLRSKSEEVTALLSRDLPSLAAALSELPIKLAYINLGQIRDFRETMYFGFEAKA